MYAEDSDDVQLFVYDMTKGLANTLSVAFLGRHIEGVWHTGIIAYGREYFYGGAGIESCSPGGTVLGQPDRVLKLGQTEVPYSLFLEYVFGLGESSFRPGTYDLFKHNCNNFSNEVSTFLTGTAIPEYIVNLPDDILSTPLGESLRPMIESLSLRAQGSRGVSFGARAEEAAQRRFENDFVPDSDEEVAHLPPVAGRESSSSPQLPPTEPPTNNETQPSSALSQQPPAQQQKQPVPQSAAPPPPTADSESRELRASRHAAAAADRQRSHQGHSNAVVNAEEEEMADAEGSESSSAPREGTPDGEESVRPRKEKKPRVPAIVFTDVNPVQAFEDMNKHLKELLSEEELQFLAELCEFVLEDTGAWALGAQHLQMIGRLVQDKSVSKEGKVALIKFLQAAALKDDVILLLHMDRKDHALMNYINEFEKLDPEIQEEIATLICNLCQPATASDWLLYISEWQYDGQSCSNGRVTTRVAVNSLLDARPSMQQKGVNLMYNIGNKEVFDDTATELSSAILQHLHSDLSEEHAFHLLSSLLRFMSISYNDVPALVKMMGPDLSKFKGTSTRVDEIVEQIDFKLSMVGGA